MSAAVETPAEELSEGGYEMLRVAVNTTREHQCRSLATLRMRMTAAWPGRESDIEEALKFWGQDIARRYPGGVPRY